MTSSELPGGFLPLALVWFGGAGLLCAGIVLSIHGEAVPVRGLLLVFGWAMVALLIGFALNALRLPMLRLAGMLWLVVAAGGAGWLWWLQNA